MYCYRATGRGLDMFFFANMLIISSMDMAPWPQLLLLKFKSGSNLPEGRAPLRQSWNDATTHPSLPYSLQKCQIAPCSSEQYTTAWPHYHIATTHSALTYNFPQLHCHIAKHSLLFLTYCQIATLHTTLLFRIKHEKPSVPAGSLTYSQIFSCSWIGCKWSSFASPWTPWQDHKNLIGGLISIFDRSRGFEMWSYPFYGL